MILEARATLTCGGVKGGLSSVWIPIKTFSDGIWYWWGLYGFTLVSGLVQLSLLIIGANWGIESYRLFNYLSDFAENRLEGIHMCRDNACELISLSDSPFKSYAQKSECPV